MKKAAVCLVAALLAVTAIPLLAQSGVNDTLNALLVEVRLLRMAMERSATAPELQLLGTRLTVQNDRLQEATRAHALVRNELQVLLNQVADHTAELQRIEEETGANLPAQHREKLDQYQKNLKSEITAKAAHETQLRARESELAAAVAAEQNQWLLMNQRLDELERALRVR
jgi:peptidoglycan hydrolase CwlO-like protein